MGPVVTLAWRIVTYLVNALSVKNNWWLMDVARDAIKWGKIAFIGVKHRVILTNLALKYHAKLRSESTVSVNWGGISKLAVLVTVLNSSLNVTPSVRRVKETRRSPRLSGTKRISKKARIISNLITIRRALFSLLSRTTRLQRRLKTHWPTSSWRNSPSLGLIYSVKEDPTCNYWCTSTSN